MMREERTRRGSVGLPSGPVGSNQWSEVLSHFVEEHRGAPLSIRVVQSDGSTAPLDGTSNVELRLMSLLEEERRGERVLLLFAHKHPGAEIAQIEFSGAVGLDQRDSSLSVHAADGCRMELNISGGRRTS